MIHNMLVGNLIAYNTLGVNLGLCCLAKSDLNSYRILWPGPPSHVASVVICVVVRSLHLMLYLALFHLGISLYKHTGCETDRCKPKNKQDDGKK